MRLSKTIGERLSEARTALRLSQARLCQLSGVPISTHKKYEASDSVPGGDAVAGYVRAGINANWLLTGEGPMLLAELRRPDAALDVSLLNDVLAAIDEHLADRNKRLSPAKKAELASLLYESFIEAEPKPTHATIIKLVRAMAA